MYVGNEFWASVNNDVCLAQSQPRRRAALHSTFKPTSLTHVATRVVHVFDLRLPGPITDELTVYMAARATLGPAEGSG